MVPTISQVCSLNSPLEKDVEDYAAGQCRSLEIWLTKLESYLQRSSPEEFQRLLQEYEMQAPAASFQGGLLISQGPQRAEAWELFRRRLDLCRQVGIGTIVVACDMIAPLNHQDIERGRASLGEASREAEARGVRVALEFQARAAFGNNLQTAAALVAEVDSRHLGLCLDVFHFHVGPSKLQDLGLLTRDNLFHVQLSDVAGVTRELAADADRILPGEGDVAFEPILARLREIAYEGCISLETMNPRIWQVPALQFGEIGMTSLRKVLGIAER